MEHTSDSLININNKPEGSYSFLIDNIKTLLIVLVVFNHLIAFQLVKYDQVASFIRYGVTLFHMPAFIFVSGYLSKREHSVLHNMKTLLVPYVISYFIVWSCFRFFNGNEEFRILIPIGGTWYFLVLFIYRITCGGISKIRWCIPVTILVGLLAGTQTDFSIFLTMSRAIVYYPFFLAGYFWTSPQTQKLRQSKWKWCLLIIGLLFFFLISWYFMKHGLTVNILKQDRCYSKAGLSNLKGIVLRSLMYMGAFSLTFSIMAFMSDKKTPFSYLGKNSVSIYFFHYPLLFVSNRLGFLSQPLTLNWAAHILITILTVLLTGSAPVNRAFKAIMNKVTAIVFCE
ncbi:MAG: acyltransferase family protein [Eubacterium sp.]|nr:acyltransferase family protein [Eubacterium sp.]